MNEVRVNTYQPFAGQKPSVVIIIDEPIPDVKGSFPESLIESDREFDRQAELIFQALKDNLPGGTIDRLTAKLLIYKANHFVVNYEQFIDKTTKAELDSEDAHRTGLAAMHDGYGGDV